MPKALLTLVAVPLVAASLLSACGGDDGSTTSEASSGGGATNVQQILDYIGPIDQANAGKGKSLDLGVTVALSGDGAFYGDIELKGARLAAKQIEELGGPEFNVIAKDNRSADPAAGVRAARELGESGVQLALSSYSADIGAMLPGIEKYKMLTLDGGGGTFLYAQGKPFFWGTRANTPTDAYPGIVEYLQSSMPEVERVSVVAWDLGPLNEVMEDEVRSALEEGGIELAGYEPTPIGTTDYAVAIQHLKDQEPGAIFTILYGLDLANFMKQYVTAGIGEPTIGFDFTEEGAAAAGSALDGYMFAYDFFDPADPPNDWAKIFVDSYREEYGEEPNYLAANYYEDVFSLWDLVRRVLADGGNPNDGPALQEALLANPTFKSVYGGDAETAGTLRLDKKSHSVSRREMGLFRYDAGPEEIEVLAFFNIGGADFRKP